METIESLFKPPQDWDEFDINITWPMINDMPILSVQFIYEDGRVVRHEYKISLTLDLISKHNKNE